MPRGNELRLRRGHDGWPNAWRQLLRGIGVYDQHRGLSNEQKGKLVDRELARFGGYMVSISTDEVVIWFPGREEMMHFQMVWA